MASKFEIHEAKMEAKSKATHYCHVCGDPIYPMEIDCADGVEFHPRNQFRGCCSKECARVFYAAQR